MSDNTFNNLNLVLQKDLGASQQIEFDTTTTDVGIELKYDLGTANPKTFKLNRNGINFTDNTTNNTTGLDRLAVIQQAFSAVQLPPNSNTLKVNNTLELNYDGSNNIIFDQVADYPVNPYVTPIPESQRQTRLSKDTNDDIDFAHLQEVMLTKNVTPNYNINNIDVSYNTIGAIAGSPNNLTISRSLFPNNKIAYTIPTYSNPYSQTIYIQEFATSNFLTINLATLGISTLDISYPVNNITSAQILPVSYTSAVNCRFFVRFTASNTNSDLYILECNGDPTLAGSYTWASQSLLCNANGTGGIVAGVTKANGVSALPLTSVAQGVAVGGARTCLGFYDDVNDVIVCYNGNNNSLRTGRFITVVNRSLTAATVYYLGTFPLGVGAFPFINAHLETKSFFYSYYDPSGVELKLHSVIYDPVTPKITFSPYTSNILANVPNYEFNVSSNNWDTYSYDDGTDLYLYFFWANNNASSREVSLATYKWDKVIGSNITFVGTTLIENVGTTPLAFSLTTYNLGFVYYTVKVYDTNNIEVFSSWTNASGTGTDGRLYITNDNFATSRTVTLTNICNGRNYFGNTENDYNFDATTDILMSTMYPVLTAVRGSWTNPNNPTLTDAVTITTSYTQPTPQKYLTFDYDLSNNLATVISTKDITFKGTPLTLDASSNNLKISNLSSTNEYSRLNIKNGIVYSSNNFYGQYLCTNDQTVGTTAAILNLDTVTMQYGLTFNNTTDNVTLNTVGVFKIGVSMLITESGGSNREFYFCFVANDINIANSGSVVYLTSNNSSHLVYAEIFYNCTNPNTTIGVRVKANVGSLTINNIGGITDIANAPAAILTINQIE